MSVLSTANEGKFLMNKKVEQIGIVAEVDTDAQIAYVESDPSITKAVLRDLGSGDTNGDDVEVPAKSVETVTDSELHIAKDL